MLIKLFSDKKLHKVDIDSPERIETHRKILNKKKMIREVFLEFHEKFLVTENKYFKIDGLRVELGAGVFPIKFTDKKILASDVVESKENDLVINAEKMIFKKNTVKTFFLQNVFHHFANPDKFFREADRTIKEGGGIIMIEPYYNFISKILYKNISNNEFFDINQTSWTQQEAKAMSGANQALAHNIFVRDKVLFTKKYKNFEIVEIRPLNNYLRYILSGGLNFKQLFPNSLSFILKIIEFILKPFNKFFSIHYIIVIKKKGSV